MPWKDWGLGGFGIYWLRNELTHFEGSPSTRARQEARQQQLMHRLEMLQARYEGNRLLY